MEELAKVDETMTRNSIEENDFKLNSYLQEKKDEYLTMLNELPKSIHKERDHQRFRLSFKLIEELFLKIEKAKKVSECEKKTLHEKAGKLTLFFKDILGVKEKEHFDFCVMPNL